MTSNLSIDTQPDTQEVVQLKGCLRLRSGRYYYRRRVPMDLYPRYFKGREISKSLNISAGKAGNLQRARELAKQWDMKSDKVFHVCRLIVLSDEQKLEVIKNELYPSKETPLPAEIKTVRLNDVFKNYVEKNRINWVEKTTEKVQYSLDLAIKVIGDQPVDELTPKMFDNYLKTLRLLPPNMTKSPKYRDKSVKQIVSLKYVVPMSDKTVLGHIDFLGSALASAKLRYLLDDLVLPKIKNQADTERIDYELTDLQTILNNLHWVPKYPERFWIPLIGMLHGWREAEVCQIMTHEIFKVEDLWCVKIRFKKNDDNFHQTLPLHPMLLELGFTDYAEKVKHIQLFPGLKENKGSFANAFQKWYGRFNRDKITNDPQKVFHSFRHTFVTWLNNETNVKEHLIQFVVGHSMKKNVTRGRYTKKPKPEQLLDTSNLLFHNLLDWTHVRAEAKKC